MDRSTVYSHLSDERVYQERKFGTSEFFMDEFDQRGWLTEIHVRPQE